MQGVYSYYSFYIKDNCDSKFSKELKHKKQYLGGLTITFYVPTMVLAIMNQSFVLVCNSADEDMAKSSAIISPWGDVVRDDALDVIRESVDLRLVRKYRRLIPMG